MNDDKLKKEEKDIEEKVEKKAEDETDGLKKKNEELENSYRRALADYQNLHKRVNEEKQNWIKIANKELLSRLLTVLDTLILANKHKDDKDLKVILNQFLEVLKAEGVVRVEAEGKKFDPQHMEAMEIVEGEDEKVIEEVRAGFMIHDILLRPAQVKVGKKKE